MKMTNSLIDPMTYPLFYIYGGRGWDGSLKKLSKNPVQSTDPNIEDEDIDL